MRHAGEHISKRDLVLLVSKKYDTDINIIWESQLQTKKWNWRTYFESTWSCS